jgi:hypothetical protein
MASCLKLRWGHRYATASKGQMTCMSSANILFSGSGGEYMISTFAIDTIFAKTGMKRRVSGQRSSEVRKTAASK